LKARNAELLEMLSHMQDASEELRVRSLTIPGQEARFGNRSLDNRSVGEENAEPGPSESKTLTRAMSADKEKGAVPETQTPGDVKMGQYTEDLVTLLKKIKLAHSLDESSETTN
jgi:hypothetical protein